MELHRGDDDAIRDALLELEEVERADRLKGESWERFQGLWGIGRIMSMLLTGGIPVVLLQEWITRLHFPNSLSDLVWGGLLCLTICWGIVGFCSLIRSQSRLNAARYKALCALRMNYGWFVHPKRTAP